ncbi:hypothetical protein THAOC_24121 [Thalassiosira oceanica]|uniref:Uncharacterized protein n=1 Tax=Thalassiosira oceanica TaxID=159749 RepID=K0RUG3_THAOC|nr:hypothetical protein THAOC_24121 [Thalassiosira oceanica]|eukprot:EJK56059.1 hypothetical protein THAOC_24121 [Thalassiosira oceanica]
MAVDGTADNGDEDDDRFRELETNGKRFWTSTDYKRLNGTKRYSLRTIKRYETAKSTDYKRLNGTKRYSLRTIKRYETAKSTDYKRLNGNGL